MLILNLCFLPHIPVSVVCYEGIGEKILLGTPLLKSRREGQYALQAKELFLGDMNKVADLQLPNKKERGKRLIFIFISQEINNAHDSKE